MTNETARRFLDALSQLTPRCPAASHSVLSLLLSEKALTILLDPRGTFLYLGPSASTEGLLLWTAHFQLESESRQEFLFETERQAFVRLHARGRHGCSERSALDWTRYIEVEDGMVVRFEQRIKGY